jgi:FkbM family methyltransferase
MCNVVCPEGEVFAFEPNPVLSKSLEIMQTDYAQLKVINRGLSNACGTLTLNVPVGMDGHGSFIQNAGSVEKNLIKYDVEVVTLDDYLQKMTILPVKFIKIDVEGFELNVLKGAKKTLINSRPTLVLESYTDEINDFFKFLDYKTYSFFGGDPKDGNIHNYIAVPVEKDINFISTSDLGKILIENAEIFNGN